jgi:hypothetical protein
MKPNSPNMLKMFKHLCPLLLLVVVAAFGNGCMTPMLVDSATHPTYTHDRFQFVERAYRTPKQDLIVCTSGTLANASKSERYHIVIPRESVSSQQPRAARPPQRGVTIEQTVQVSRNVHKDWPTEVEVERERLVPVPIAPVVLPRQTFNNPASVTEAVRNIVVRDDTIVNFGGGEPFGFALMQTSQRGETVQLTPCFLKPHESRRGLFKLVALPVTVAADAVLVPVAVITVPIWLPFLLSF